MSLSHVNFKEEQKTVQITLRVFIDDLQDEINLSRNTNLIEIDSDKEPENIDILFENYLNEKYKVNINSEKQEYQYIGKKYDFDMVIFYLEIENIQSIETIKIENNILFSLYSEQENIVKTNINNIKKSHILTNNNNNTLINY